MTRLTTIDASGDGHRIGQAIAAATGHLRDQVEQWTATAMAAYRPGDPEVRAALLGVRSMLEKRSPSTLGQIEGMAAGYDVSADGLLAAVLTTYFASAGIGVPERGRDCSTFAVRGSSRRQTVLAKNRDSGRRFLTMQTVVRVRPASGYDWLALSTAGAPGVHSAGINSRGLAVADTHVPSRDVGIGLPRFSLMMHALEQCATTAEAIAYLRSVPRMGLGNLILTDAGGAVAVVECGHVRLAVIEDSDGCVIATNHFVSESLADACRQPPDSAEGRDSRWRHRRLTRALAGPDTVVDDPAGLLSAHEQPGATCVHGDEAGDSTIATVIARPGERSLSVCAGNPCRAPMRTFRLGTPPVAAEDTALTS